MEGLSLPYIYPSEYVTSRDFKRQWHNAGRLSAFWIRDLLVVGRPEAFSSQVY